MKLIEHDAALAVEQYEARRLDETQQECYCATSSRFNKSFLGEKPYVPVRDQNRLALRQIRPIWPNDAPFAVCLTHDVDNVAWHSLRMHGRRMLAQVRHLFSHSLERRAIGALRSTVSSLMKSMLPGQHDDPLHCYERWLELEAEFDVTSTFLFLPDIYDRPHFSDGGYRYSDTVRFDDRLCSVADMIQEVHRRGWEVGLHPSWYSYSSAPSLRRDKERLEAIIQAPIVSARQHFLHFDIRHTPQAYQEAGLLYDSSLGFNDDVGFRSGTCWPFELPDLQRQAKTRVIELPLIIQDKCLTNILGKGNAQCALDLGMRMAGEVETVGGVLTLLWHPRLVNDPLSMEVYRSLLHRLKERGAWFGTMADVGSWWTKECAQWT